MVYNYKTFAVLTNGAGEAFGAIREFEAVGSIVVDWVLSKGTVLGH